jgi:hypothetical protein
VSIPDFDNNQAVTEGWYIADCDGSDNGPYQIQKLDDENVFSKDDEAWDHVVAKAREGSAYHLSAIEYIRVYNPREFIFFCDWTDWPDDWKLK